jgi:hypothetical protein
MLSDMAEGLVSQVRRYAGCMNGKYATKLRPIRGVIYTLFALALALFGLVGLQATKWSADTFAIAAWCGVCAAGLGWRAWANLTGDRDIAKTSKPAMGKPAALESACTTKRPPRGRSSRG